MNKIIVGGVLVATAFFLPACNTNESRYLNLKTGEPVVLKEDEKTGLLVDAETEQPIELYVDTKTNDTVWGRSGKVINGRIKKDTRSNGAINYVYLDDETAVKKERENDGDLKYKDGNTKIKSENGEYKIKRGDYKKEVEKDGDIIIKDGNKKIKIDGETGERKVKYDN